MRSGVSGVVLAAGTSSRMVGGTPKQMLELGGQPLVRRVTQAALDSRLDEVIVVLGHAREQVTGALDGLEVKEIKNPDYRQGQSTSVRAGLCALALESRAAVFLPADQPLISSRLIDRLIDVYRRRSSSGDIRDGGIAVSVHDGRRGAPVLFDRAFFGELADLEGDAGGRQLLPRYSNRIVEVEVGDPWVLADVDTREDLRRLQQAIQSGADRR